MRRLVAIVLLSCSSGPPQTKTQAAITYHIKFTGEPTQTTTAIFPMPTDVTNDTLMSSLQASEDGGQVKWFMTMYGNGIGIVGMGTVSADLKVAALEGFPSGEGAPDASLSLHVSDGGPEAYYIDVQRPGLGLTNVEFEYTATRDCGPGCGGKRSWTFSGETSPGEEPVSMTYVEEN